MLDKASTASSIRQLTRIIIKLVVVTVLLLMCRRVSKEPRSISKGARVFLMCDNLPRGNKCATSTHLTKLDSGSVGTRAFVVCAQHGALL